MRQITASILGLVEDNEAWIKATARKYAVRFESHIYQVTDAQFEKFLQSFLAKVPPEDVEMQRAAMTLARDMLKDD